MFIKHEVLFFSFVHGIIYLYLRTPKKRSCFRFLVSVSQKDYLPQSHWVLRMSVDCVRGSWFRMDCCILTQTVLFPCPYMLFISLFSLLGILWKVMGSSLFIVTNFFY